MMWKIQQAMQDDAIGAGLKRSYGKIFSALTEMPVGNTEISGTEAARPLI